MLAVGQLEGAGQFKSLSIFQASLAGGELILMQHIAECHS